MAGPQVVVIGGGPAAAALVHGLHRGGHEGSVVVLAGEGCTPYDRTAVSKGLLTGEVAAAPELFPEVLTADVVRHADVVEIDRAAREVVTGDGDCIMPPSNAAKIAERIGGALVQRTVLAGTGHLWWLGGPQRRQAMDAVTRFMGDAEE